MFRRIKMLTEFWRLLSQFDSSERDARLDGRQLGRVGFIVVGYGGDVCGLVLEGRGRVSLSRTLADNCCLGSC